MLSSYLSSSLTTFVLLFSSFTTTVLLVHTRLENLFYYEGARTTTPATAIPNKTEASAMHCAPDADRCWNNGDAAKSADAGCERLGLARPL